MISTKLLACWDSCIINHGPIMVKYIGLICETIANIILTGIWSYIKFIHCC